jgi:divinyl chlorophyllide a 8-vinyl-reductase
MASATAEKPAPAPSAVKKGKRVLVVGPTGYIGKYVTMQLIQEGYDVVAMSRPKSGIGGNKSEADVQADFEGAEVVFGDVCDPESISQVFKDHQAEGFDTVVSCLASRTGGIEDSWKIDYQATSNCLHAARKNKVRHFVLLSAICVQKPLLEFQRAKLAFEEELMNAGDISYSIVRPTAFFKSLAGQVKSVMGGGPYVMFGDGQLAACKPISERDLASFMVRCIEDEDKCNKVLPIGGPGEAMTALQQGNVLFDILGKKPFFIKVPLGLMDFVIGILDFFAGFNPQGLEDAAEFGRIGKYYASESMLVYDPVAEKYLPGSETPSYGEDTLEAFFRRAVKEGGLEGQELGDAAIFSE